MIFGRRFPPPLVQRRPQAARHQTPVARAASCRLARALGRARGRGASGPPSGGRGQPKENHGRAPDRGPPPPRRRAAGGAPPGEVGLGAGGARTQARPPTPRPGGHSQRPGHRHHGRAPRRGGCGPPHPGGQQRDRTQADHGPGAPPPATSQHQRRRGRPGRGRTRPGRCDGAGAAGPGQYRPGLHPTGRIPFSSQPATFGGGLGQPPRGRPRPQGAPAPETAGGPRGPGAAAYGAGAIPPGRGAASAAKKRPGVFPPGWTRLDEKKMRGGRFVPPACRYSGYQISPCSA